MKQLDLELRPDERAEARPRVRLRIVRAPLPDQPELPGLDRPRVRAHCERLRDTYAACPYVGCRHHLFGADSGHHAGRLEAFAELLDVEPTAWPSTCSLDAAEQWDRPWSTPDKSTPLVLVGEALGISGERARQIQRDALAKLEGEDIEYRGSDVLEWFGD